MPDKWRSILGWFPVVVLPWATADQLCAILRSGSAEGVSALTWGLFLFANIGSIGLAWPRTPLAIVQVSLAFGLTALLDIALLAAIAVYH